MGTNQPENVITNMMFDITTRRLLLALIFLCSNLAVTAHSVEKHKTTDNIKCELCVAQGSTHGMLHVAETSLRVPAYFTDFPVFEKPESFTDCTYPAWASRAPPV